MIVKRNAFKRLWCWRLAASNLTSKCLVASVAFISLLNPQNYVDWQVLL